MINCTKLLQSTETLREIERYSKVEEATPKWMLRFSKVNSPMVVWNTTKECNLRCAHCYLSAGRAEKGELTTREAMNLIEDLAVIKSPMLVFSGGEPVLRKDIYELNEYAMELGLKTILSSNGALITTGTARKIKESRVSYVGIDLDGLAQKEGEGIDVLGGLEKALPSMKYLKGAGLRYGVRITLGDFNFSQLDSIVEAVENAGIRRFAACQLLMGRDWAEVKRERRRIMDFLLDYAVKNPEMEVVTEHFYADGAYIVERLKERGDDRAEAVKELLAMQGGCPAGRKLININHKGDLHPCLYWKSQTIGNIRQASLSELWSDSNPLLAKLRNREAHLKGKCSRCPYSAGCGGCRDRAEEALHDCFQSDPACYV